MGSRTPTVPPACLVLAATRLVIRCEFQRIKQEKHYGIGESPECLPRQTIDQRINQARMLLSELPILGKALLMSPASVCMLLTAAKAIRATTRAYSIRSWPSSLNNRL